MSSSSSSAAVGTKRLPARSTRGSRMTDMHKEGDDEFWNQEFFQDGGEEDDDYDLSGQEDSADSDFSDSEEESDEEEQVVQRERTSRRNVYQEPTRKRQKVQVGGGGSAAARPKRQRKKSPAVPVNWEPRKVRERTRIKTNNANQRDKQQSQKKKVVRKVKVHKKWTQEELLQEAKQTEEENKKSLAELLRLEEKNKHVARTKAQPKGPRIVYRFTKAMNTVTVLGLPKLPSYMEGEEQKYPPETKCFVTGKKARYRDPKTREGFRNVQAFQRIRPSK